MIPSILNTVKKLLGIEEDYTIFDSELIVHINTVFGILFELGIIDPAYHIESESDTWEQIGYDNSLKAVQSYIYMRVKLLFDPPTTSYLLTSLEKTATEMEWRLRDLSESQHIYE